MKKYCFLLFVLYASVLVNAQKADEAIRSGNEYYRQEQFEKSDAAYKQALAADPANNLAKYNLANSLYKQGKEEEAIQQYKAVAADAKEPELRSKAYYNHGVILSKQKKLEQSIEAYKNALRQNPEDQEARENLQKALLELKKKNPPPKKEQKEDQKKQDQQKKKQQSKMSPKEAEQRLKLLEQKEKQVQQRLQKSSSGGGQTKDW